MMEGEIHVDAPLDYVSFKIFPADNRYEAYVSRDNKMEQLASGRLEQLQLHIPQVKLDGHCKLQLPDNLKRLAWFSKSTLSRFLHIVDSPEMLKIANACGDEMTQLEESRKFHLALYAQDRHKDPQTEETECRETESVELTEKPDFQSTSSDVTKNELLRALELRLTALREELVAAFNQAADATCSLEQIAHLVAFSRHYGGEYIRNSLSKYLELNRKNHDTDSQNEQAKVSQDSHDGGVLSDATAQVPAAVKAVKYGASPAKVAEVERQNSTESEESSNSSDEDQPSTERSRPLIRSISPRRSASPMRRVQIGRSGSHRAPALTIKSLSYFPAREKLFSNKDTGENSSEEESDQPLKKPGSTARSISVQDAINLFERKQKDENSDMQKRRFSADTSVNTNKSVLRRWSGRTGNSSPQRESENAFEGGVDMATGEVQNNPVKLEPESDLALEGLDSVKTADVSEPLKVERKASHPIAKPADPVSTPAIETSHRVSASVDWSQQKEDELNHMMMKMVEIKPIRQQRMGNGNSKSQELPSGQRGASYDLYKKKRDENVRGEKSGKRAEEQLKSFQEILDQRKAEMTSRTMGVAGKQESLIKSRKPQNKSSPPVQPKWESSKSSKPSVSRKTPAKASSLPATRKSWPSAPSPKTAGITPSKVSDRTSSVGTAVTRRKSQPTPPPTQPRLKVERSQKTKESAKATPTETKRNLRGQEGNKQQAVASSKAKKTRDLQTVGDGSSPEPAKPSFYNKVTKKGSVVPLESKPFLRKRSGMGPGVGPASKMKAPHPEESVKSNTNILIIEAEEEEEEEVVAGISESVIQQHETDVIQPVSDVTDLEPEASKHSHQKCENTENNDVFVSEGNDSFQRTAEFPVESEPHEVSEISPIAWVEIEEHQELPGESCSPQNAISTNVAPETLSSPRVRHSLSQMLQEDGGEPEIMEWGNAENPPAIIYQKDAPKGLKRLLKFARKSKGEANVTGWSSPSVFSEGEEDADEPKDTSVGQVDAIFRKASLQAKGGKQKTSFASSNHGGNSGKGAIDSTAASDILSAQTNMSRFASQSSHKLQEGHTAATSTKSARSFFSLSTFRSSK